MSRKSSIFAPQGHFRRAADMEYVIPGCTGLRFTRLRGEMVGAMRHPFGIQDSGSCWEWGRWARFRGESPCLGPPTWSDRCYPNRTDTPCSDPGCHASWIPHDFSHFFARSDHPPDGWAPVGLPVPPVHLVFIWQAVCLREPWDDTGAASYDVHN